jgi:hypothetical protein
VEAVSNAEWQSIEDQFDDWKFDDVPLPAMLDSFLDDFV